MSRVPALSCVLLGFILSLLPAVIVRALHKHGDNGDLHLWIDREQVEKFGGRYFHALKV